MIFKSRMNRKIKQAKDTDDVYEHPDVYKGTLTDKQCEKLDEILGYSANHRRMKMAQNIMKLHAKEFNRTPEIECTLNPKQALPVLMYMVNNEMFIGDAQGVGKTIESMGMCAARRLIYKKKGLKPKGIVVVTMTAHVEGFAKEWKSFGINLLPVNRMTKKVKEEFENFDLDKYDGVILNWESLIKNNFLRCYMLNEEKFNTIVLDETKYLLNEDNNIVKVLEVLIHQYGSGIQDKIFLNASSFKKDLFNLHSQFKLLNPKILGTKQSLENEYVKRAGGMQYGVALGGSNAQQNSIIARNTGDIVGYKNETLFKDRARYYYLARSKSEFGVVKYEPRYDLVLFDMTEEQEKQLEIMWRMSLVNSPETGDTDLTLTIENSPKLEYLFERLEAEKESRPVVYIRNKAAQYTVQRLLEERGYSVGVVNGRVVGKKKNQIITKYNEGKLDYLIFNVEEAVNIPNSHLMFFYDIPTIPQQANQIKARIDRNNYDIQKRYEFLCYIDSPEMVNLVRLAFFREKYGNAFTGNDDFVYAKLLEQLSEYLTEDELGILGVLTEELEQAKGREAEKVQHKIYGVLKHENQGGV